MRSLARVSVIVMFVLSLAPPRPAPAATDTLAALAGRWHCTVAGRHAAERYYSLFAAGEGPGARTLYGRAETTEADGSPSESFERIAQHRDRSVHIEATEGNGDAPAPGDALPLSFTDDAPGARTSLSYMVDGNTMQRSATYNGTTVDSERCTRVFEKPFDPNCAQPNQPATTLHAADAYYPPAAIPLKASGTVYLMIVLDEHSRLLWTDVVGSSNSVFNDESVHAARLSTFRTEIRGCKPIAARFLFSVDFSYNRK